MGTESDETRAQRANGAVSGRGESELAKEILAASRRILIEKGLSELTISSICRETGAYRGAVNHQFGGKEGLLAAVIDDVVHESAQRLAGQVQGLPPGDQRVRETIRGFGMLGGAEAQLAFFEVFTHLLRDEAGRARLLRIYEDMLAIIGVALGGAAFSRRPGATPLAAIAMAAADGLVIQQLIGPLVDYEEFIATLAALITPALDATTEAPPE
jgi:AcrR family transcriptional regulator